MSDYDLHNEVYFQFFNQYFPNLKSTITKASFNHPVFRSYQLRHALHLLILMIPAVLSNLSAAIFELKSENK